MTIWVDADSCAKRAREHILKYSSLFSVPVIFVANKTLSSESNFPFQMIITSQTKDSADNYIIENSTSSIKDFIEILEKNGARGRRKYIRLDTRNMRDVNGYLAHGDKLYSINIKDISSAGFAITYKQDIAPVFQKNARLTNLSITAGRKSQVCSCIVFNTMVNNDGTAMSVLLLASETPDSFRTFIRNYIFEKNNIALQNQLDAIKKDLTSYTDASEYKNLRSDVKAATNEEKPEEKKDE